MMTLYEITKKYGDGKGEAMMWKTVKVVSEAVEANMDDEAKKKLMRKVFGAMSDGHYTEELAMADVSQMRYTDDDGKVHKAPLWPKETVLEIYDKRKADIPNYNEWDFVVTMNMLGTDNWCMLKRWFPDDDDTDTSMRVADMAVVWLKDEDWPTKTKIWDYLSVR